MTAAPAIQLSRVSRVYSGSVSTVALKDLDLSVEAGGFVAVMGPSGSGKSTLLQLIGLLDAPSSGSVTVFGVDAASLSDRDASEFRARHIGFVFQAFHLLHSRTVLDNVLLPLKYSGVSSRGERDRRAIECLAQVGLADRSRSLPSELSGGEQQRVAIARALATGPSLLLCDEPTGNLDAETTERVLDVIDRIREWREVTVLVVTHDEHVSQRADRVIRLAARTQGQ